MAKTTSKSSKAKTKTTAGKKPGAKKPAEAKAAAVKESKVEANVTAPVKKADKPAKVKRARKEVTLYSLRRLHAFSIVLFAALAATALALMQAVGLTLSSGFLAKNELASTATTVFTPAQRVIYDIDVRYALVGLLVLSLLLTFGRSRRMWKEEQAGIARRILPWRWVDFALTGMMAVEVTALTAGLSDIVAIKSLGLLTVAAALFAWLAERENAGSARAVRAPFYASVIFGLLTILLLSAPLMDTLVYSEIRSPWYAYALWGVVAASFVATGWNQWKSLKHGAVWNYLYVERNYIAINILAKTAFALILIIGLMK